MGLCWARSRGVESVIQLPGWHPPSSPGVEGLVGQPLRMHVHEQRVGSSPVSERDVTPGEIGRSRCRKISVGYPNRTGGILDRTHADGRDTCWVLRYCDSVM